MSDEAGVTIAEFLLARIAEDEDEARRASIYAAAGTDDAPDPGTGIVEPVALPGQPWPGGSVCRSCARVASGPPVTRWASRSPGPREKLHRCDLRLSDQRTARLVGLVWRMMLT